MRFWPLILLLFGVFFPLSKVQGQLYNFQSLSVDKGLGQSGLYAIAEGPKGLLWIGLEHGGYQIFDGEHFSAPDAHIDKAGRDIRCIFKDSKNRMWLGSSQGGISIVNGETIKQITSKNGLPSDHIRGFAEDDRGNLWVATLYGGIAILKDGLVIQQFNKLRGLPDNNCRYIKRISDGRIAVGTDKGLVVFKNGKPEQIFDVSSGLSSNKVLCFDEDDQGALWVGTQSGLNRILGTNIQTFNKADGLIDNRVKAVLIDSQGRLWVGTQKGLCKISNADRIKGWFIFKDFTKANGLSNERIRCLYEDVSGAIWIGTFSGGINKFFNESFSILEGSFGLSEEPIVSVYYDVDEEILWMGTFGDGVQAVKNGRPFKPRLPFKDGTITAIEKLNEWLFFGTQSGLEGLDPTGELHRFEYDYLLSNASIQKLNLFKNKLIVQTNSGSLGVYEFRNDSLILDTLFTQSLMNQFIGDFWVLDDGLWLKNDSSIQLYNGANRKIQVRDVVAFDKANNTSWGVNKAGYVFYVNANDSVVIVNPQSPLSLVRGLYTESDTSIWISLNQGVVHVLKQSEEFRFKKFRNTEGFMGIQAYSNAICGDDNGGVYVGTMKGCLRIDPEGYEPKKHQLNVELLEVLYNNQSQDWTIYADTIIDGVPYHLELPYKMNHVGFRFRALHLKNQNEVFYKWRLKGEEEEFVGPLNKTEVDYQHLLPGTYTLEVYARTQWGDWTTNPMTFTFTITPPFYLTLGFIIPVLLGAILMIYLVLTYRTRKLQKEKVKLALLVKERTSELELEKEKSENLLLNILPVEVAQELKVYGASKAKKYEKASVLFTDFKGFTAFSQQMSPEDLVQDLDTIFKGFDEIIERNNLEKIKTIGDAYMCVSGIPENDQFQTRNIVIAGLQIIQFMEEYNAQKRSKGTHEWPVRVGVHTGELVAGVVGKKKFAYDVWGDTVNVASRMESQSEPGCLNVSEETYEAVKTYFECEARGEIEVKNRGALRMYFIRSLKPEYSKDGRSFLPNQMYYN